MAFVKTRIWRGGVAGTGGSDSSLSSPPTLDGGAVDPERPPEPSAEELARWELAAQRQTQAHVLPGFEAQAAQSRLATTRFMPIEQLFPEERAALREMLEAGPRPAPVPPRARGWLHGAGSYATTFVSRPRRWNAVRRAIFALVVAVVVLAAKLALSSTRRELIPAPTSSTAAVPKAASARALGGAAPAAATLRAKDTLEPSRLAEARDTPRPAAHRPDLERAAIDAVIAGDLTRAQELYRQLADAAPDAVVYREALRIIRSRASGGQ